MSTPPDMQETAITAMPPAAARPAVRVRDSRDADVPALQRIYAHHVLNGVASFELEPPDVGTMASRRAEVLARGMPYLVAELDGVVAGYAYAGPYRARPAYRFTLENSVYIADEARGRGVGRALLAELLLRCERTPARQMVAVIGDSANLASIRLHASLGFVRTGLLPAVGWKFGRWVDSVLMQRPLGSGDGTPPAQ